MGRGFSNYGRIWYKVPWVFVIIHPRQKSFCVELKSIGGAQKPKWF